MRAPLRSAPRIAPLAAAREATPPELRRMRLVATGLLLCMAALFVIARAIEPSFAWAGFVRAFAEAGMVGGMADWFAVTALFRHPLGLPIPHTAIVPRNKDRIGDTLATFLRDNFLVPRVIAQRAQRLDIAGAVARWLTDPPEGAGGRFRQGASKLVATMLEALDPQQLGGMLKAAVGKRLHETEVAPILAQLAAAAMAEGRHKPLLDAAIRWAANAVAANEQMIRQFVNERGGSILRWTGLDREVSNRLIGALDKLLAEMAANPDHPLRRRAEEGLETFAADLRDNERTRARVEAIKNELIANPAMQRWLDGLWEQARALLLGIARDPERAMAGRLGETLRQIGEALRRDRRLALRINRFTRRALVGIAADYGDGIVRLVSETVRGWDASTITRRLENQVGKDLQYIRINGTLVGGLVGLCIHIADVAL